MAASTVPAVAAAPAGVAVAASVRGLPTSKPARAETIASSPGKGCEDGDLAGQAGPVGEFHGDALVVVQDRDAGVVGHPDTSHEVAVSGN